MIFQLGDKSNILDNNWFYLGYLNGYNTSKYGDSIQCY